MSDIVAKTKISLELDDTGVGADIIKAEAVFNEMSARLQAAATITPRVVFDKNMNRIIEIDVDPKTTTAGMEVIENIVREYTARMTKEAQINVGVSKESETKIKSFAEKISGAFKYVGQGIGMGIGQAIAFTVSRTIEKLMYGAITAPFKAVIKSVEAYRIQEAAEVSLTKAIANTGNQAKQSEEGLHAYAKELEHLTNTSDQTVMGLQKVLLASEGLSGDNFKRATKAALDLSAALGGDVTNKAEKLAKALQEPKKAIEMLRDEGISFSEEQKDIVDLFVETNDIAAAQGIILDELESRYGGAADKTGTFGDKVEEAWIRFETLQERIGEAVAANDDAFIPAIEASIDAMESFAPPVVAAATVMAELATSMLNYAVGADTANLSTDQMSDAIDKSTAALKARTSATGLLIMAQLQLLQNERMLLALKGDLFDGGYLLEKVDGEIARLNKELDKNKDKELQSIKDKRAAKKTEAEAEAAQRKADFDKEKADREKALALGSGLVTEDEINKKGAKQAIKDAKKRQIEEARELKKLSAELDKKADDAVALHEKMLASEKKSREKKERDEKIAAEKAAADEEKRIKERMADEDKKAKEYQKSLSKDQADYEKNLGKEGLADLHDRIQEAILARKKQGNGSSTWSAEELEAMGKKGMRDAQKKQREAEQAAKNNKQNDEASKAEDDMFARDMFGLPNAAAMSPEQKAELRKVKQQERELRNSNGKAERDANRAALREKRTKDAALRESERNYKQGVGFPEPGSTIKVEPKQDDVVKAIQTQTTALVKATEKTGKLGA